MGDEPSFADPAFRVAMAAAIGLDIPEACVPGIDSNLALLQAYARLLMSFPLPEACEPAFEYQP